MSEIKKSQRKKNTVETRVSGCEICGFPLVHVHHTLPWAKWEVENFTLCLCANCHELLHTAISGLILKKKRSLKVWESVCEKIGKTHPLIIAIENKAYEWTETNFEFTIKYHDIEGVDDIYEEEY